MPTIKEITKIIETTDQRQPILLEGIHGIGKSEILTQIFEKKGFKVIVLFVGQNSDAGDIIGLPKIKDEHGYTEFYPPKWWPQEPNGRYVIFFDELNRGRPEIMQCIMDMVLNRRLNGRDLPKDTRIIGGMNPTEDNGYYQVSELDPAFLDRWNRYVFKPSHEEWVYWAIKAKIHKFVIGFISKNSIFLDPETNANENSKVNSVQQSRRTWVRVSDNIKLMEEKNLFDLEVLQNMLIGMVGPGASAKFIDYVKKEGQGLTAGSIILKFDKEIEKSLKDMRNPELLSMNLEMFNWFSDHYEEMKVSDINARKWISNLKKYLNAINPEIMSHFLSTMCELNNSGIDWPQLVLSLDNTLANKYLDILQGQEKQEVVNEE